MSETTLRGGPHRGAGTPGPVGPWNRAAMSRSVRVQYRSMVGFVWQQASRNLVPYLTAAQNVALPLGSFPR